MYHFKFVRDSTLTFVSQLSARASISSVSQAEASARLREKVLIDIVKTVNNLCKGFDWQTTLTFGRQPQSLTDPAPEPKHGAFIGLYGWLVEQKRYIEEDLAPMDDAEVDSRRSAVLERLHQEISKLDRMKERAWSQLVVKRFVRSLRTPDDGGPVHVESGTYLSTYECVLNLRRFRRSSAATLPHEEDATIHTCCFDYGVCPAFVSCRF